MRRRRVLVAISIAVAGGSLAAFCVARSTHDQRMADLAACLLGDRLGAGELASDRMARIELARPWSRMVRVEGSGEWAPASASAGEWPDRCADLASRAERAPASWASPATRGPLERIATALERNEIGAPRARSRSSPAFSSATKIADELFPAAVAQSLPPPSATVVRPWPPVAVLPPRSDAADPSAEPFPTGGPVGVCRAGASRVEMSNPSEDVRVRDVSLRFFDASGELRPPAAFVVTTTLAPTSKTPVLASRITLSCRPNEVRVAWAWSALVDQAATHEVVLLECKPGRCERRTAVVHVETARVSGCGLCQPEPDEFQLQPVDVVDLFGPVALVWRTGQTVRARVAPLDALDREVDTVVWRESEEPTWFDPPAIDARGDVAFVGVRRSAPNPTNRVFRFDARGVREVAVAQ